MSHPPVNPYAAPAPYGPPAQPYAGPHQPSQFFAQGGELVVQNGATLPPTCIVTGSPGQMHETRKLTWCPQWVGIVAVLISPLIGLILYFALRKSAYVTFYVSEEAMAKRRNGKMAGLITLGVSILLIVAGIAGEVVVAGLLGFLGLIVALIVGLVVGRYFHVTKIENDWVTLKLKPAASASFQSMGGPGPQHPYQPY